MLFWEPRGDMSIRVYTPLAARPARDCSIRRYEIEQTALAYLLYRNRGGRRRWQRRGRHATASAPVVEPLAAEIAERGWRIVARDKREREKHLSPRCTCTATSSGSLSDRESRAVEFNSCRVSLHFLLVFSQSPLAAQHGENCAIGGCERHPAEPHLEAARAPAVRCVAPRGTCD